MEVQALQMTPVAMRATSHLGETIDKAEKKSFGTYLKDALSEVNHLQLASEEQTKLLVKFRMFLRLSWRGRRLISHCSSRCRCAIVHFLPIRKSCGCRCKKNAVLHTPVGKHTVMT